MLYALYKRYIHIIPVFNVKHYYFKNYFFPLTTTEKNNLDFKIRNSESLVLFKKRILAFIDLP